MPKVGILGCESTTRDMDCVMIGCFGNMRGRQGMFERYTEDDPPELVGIISCGGCPTAFGTDRIWQKVKALKEYGIEALHSAPTDQDVLNRAAQGVAHMERSGYVRRR